jgi:hypothetical protein
MSIADTRVRGERNRHQGDVAPDFTRPSFRATRRCETARRDQRVRPISAGHLLALFFNSGKRDEAIFLMPMRSASTARPILIFAFGSGSHLVGAVNRHGWKCARFS